MRGVLLIVAVVLGVGGVSSPAEACVCAETPPPPDLTPETMAAWGCENARRRISYEFDRAIAVFSGEVILDEQVRVRFKHDRVWKGTLPPEFFMKTGVKRLPDGSLVLNSCDFFMRVGQKYLIFAFGSSVETMGASACTYSELFEHADRTIEVLDALIKERANAKGSVRCQSKASVACHGRAAR
jgi:hypothetical protein